MDLTTLAAAIPIVVTAASAISALFPAPAEGSKWTIVRKIIDFCAINLGNAKNVK